MSDTPYPVSVRPRAPETEPRPEGGGLEAFETPDAHQINRARMEHLESLGLELAGKRVLDVGCGVGHLAQFLVELGAHVTCVDARASNVEGLRARYPGLEAHVLNVETEALSSIGRFDVVFCYGLLYHLENPVAGVRNMAAVCDDLLLIETLVCDHREPMLVLVDEPPVNNQAVGHIGCRPSPSFVVMALNRAGFPNVYAPRSAPDHPDFRFVWRNDASYARDGRNMRCIFVASRREIESERLVPLLSADEGPRKP
jgi:SAM-dependent methyltransferase